MSVDEKIIIKLKLRNIYLEHDNKKVGKLLHDISEACVKNGFSVLGESYDRSYSFGTEEFLENEDVEV